MFFCFFFFFFFGGGGGLSITDVCMVLNHVSRPITRILSGGVPMRPKWTKLPKCIFLLSASSNTREIVTTKYTLGSQYYLCRIQC